VPAQTAPHLLLRAQDQPVCAGHCQRSRGPTRTPAGNCQAPQTRLVRPCHQTQQLLQDHAARHPRGRSAPQTAEEELDAECQGVDRPPHGRAADNGHWPTWLEKDLCCVIPHVSPTTKSVEGMNDEWMNEVNKRCFEYNLHLLGFTLHVFGLLGFCVVFFLFHGKSPFRAISTINFRLAIHLQNVFVHHPLSFERVKKLSL
jgi:hypothetical protein